MSDFVAVVQAMFATRTSGPDAQTIVGALRALPEIATVRVERAGQASTYALDIEAPDANAGAARAAAIAAGVAADLGIGHRSCVIVLYVEDGSHEYTGLREVRRVSLGERAPEASS